MKNNVKVWNYGNYSSNNYGSCRAVTIGNLDLYFSYETVIAFSSPSSGLVVRRNDWGSTTGKHLNWIDDGAKSARIDGTQFEARLQEVLQYHNLN